MGGRNQLTSYLLNLSSVCMKQEITDGFDFTSLEWEEETNYKVSLKLPNKKFRLLAANDQGIPVNHEISYGALSSCDLSAKNVLFGKP